MYENQMHPSRIRNNQNLSSESAQEFYLPYAFIYSQNLFREKNHWYPFFISQTLLLGYTIHFYTNISPNTESAPNSDQVFIPQDLTYSLRTAWIDLITLFLTLACFYVFLNSLQWTRS